MNKLKVTSTAPVSYFIPIRTNLLEICDINYMCVKKPSGDLLIPDNYAMINPDNKLMDILAKHIPDLAENYVYITLKKTFVNPGACQTKDEWHIDSYMLDGRDFTFSDSLPTKLALGVFNISLSRQESLKEYEDQIKEKDVVITEPDRLYVLGDVVHRPTRNNTDKVILRTFLKVTVTKRRFESVGNAWNYKIPDMTYGKPRSDNS